MDLRTQKVMEETTEILMIQMKIYTEDHLQVDETEMYKTDGSEKDGLTTVKMIKIKDLRSDCHCRGQRRSDL